MKCDIMAMWNNLTAMTALPTELHVIIEYHGGEGYDVCILVMAKVTK